MGIFKGIHLGVDQDEVLYHWNEGFQAEAVERYPHIEFPFLKENKSWDLTHGLDIEGVKAVEALKNLPGFYYNLRPIDGAKEALEEMEAEGIHISIITAPTVSNPTCASDKHNSLARDFGHRWAKRTVITDDKTVVMADFLIDDRPDIRGYYQPVWQHIVFDQPYNQHVTNRFRMLDWSEWRVVLQAAMEFSEIALEDAV